MYHIYTTPAFIMASYEAGEANRVYILFTRDLGLIRASAQGVRLSKSKLKSALQVMSLSNISLVKGKDFWRIVNVKEEVNIYFENSNNKELVKIFDSIFTLIRKLVPEGGEEKEFFSNLSGALHFVLALKEKNTEIVGLEELLVLRLLHTAGYIKEFGNTDLWAEGLFSLDLLDVVVKNKREIVLNINRALAAANV